MRKQTLHVTTWLAISTLTPVLFFGARATAQSTPAQSRSSVQDQDNDTTRKDVALFDQFLDGHREIADQLRRNPSLVNDKDFVKQHQALAEFLRQQPAVREEIRENPSSFIQQESRFDQRTDQRDRDTNRAELARFDQFLDSHHEIAEQLRKNPSLVNDKDFVKQHQALAEFMQQQPAVREDLRQNPRSFMQQENSFDRPADQRDRDTTRAELARFDQFLDGHHEIAEQLRKDPSLVNNREFVENHPQLETFLRQQPAVREEITENPNAFMHQENRFDHQENGQDRDFSRDRVARFHEFTDSHRDIGDQLRKNPSLVNDHQFVENHPELRDFLKTNPDLRDDLAKNPQTFAGSPRQGGADPSGIPKTPPFETKPKQ